MIDWLTGLCSLGGGVAAAAVVAWKARQANRLVWRRLGELDHQRLEHGREIAAEHRAIWTALAQAHCTTPPAWEFQGQGGEDFIAWRLADFARSGTYVDIGAFDGKTLSNTFALEQLGWTGLLVEPNPVAFEQCRDCRPNSVVVQAAVGGNDAKGTVRFEQNQSSAGAQMLSRMVPGTAAAYGEAGISVIEVPFRALNQLLSESLSSIQQIDVLSVDVEGFEFPILNDLDWKRWSPRVVIVEPNDNRVAGLLSQRGYRLAVRTECNMIFVREATA
jgi:FkbM family methyltransferase